MTSHQYEDNIDEFEAFQIRDADSRSSTPPNEFDVNIKPQYEPICDLLDDSMDNDDHLRRSTSLASSLTIESDGHDYNTSPVILNNTSRDRLIRCPVCEKPMRTFYCAKCIQTGNFVTLDSLSTNQDEFQQTVKNKLAMDNVNLEESAQSTQDIDEEKLTRASLQMQLRALRKKRDTLQSLYSGQKTKLDTTKDQLKTRRHQLEAEKKLNRSMRDKIELIKNYIDQRKSIIDKKTDRQKGLLDDVQQHAQRRVFQLTNDVFPIDEINLLEHGNSFYNNMETSPLLTFSDGSHHQFEQQTAYSIVEPWLPSNGDYSAYSLWVNENSDHIPTTMSERNPAFRIGAGLAYATQLVKNLATYLDVILPAKLDLDSFNGKLLDDAKFSYNVAKLNANIIHLCVSQGVDVSLLRPHQTLKNLTLLFNFNTSDIGRRPIFDFLDSSEVAAKIEEQLGADLCLIQEDFYDFSKFATEGDDDVSDSEWEISDTINPSEMQMAIDQSIQQNSYISRLPLRLFASFWSTTEK